MVIALLWPISVIGAMFVGFWFGAMFYDLKRLKKVVAEFAKTLSSMSTDPHKTIPEEPKTVIIDPTDLAQQVQMEQEEMMRKLNPEMYEDEQ